MKMHCLRHSFNFSRYFCSSFVESTTVVSFFKFLLLKSFRKSVDALNLSNKFIKFEFPLFFSSPSPTNRKFWFNLRKFMFLWTLSKFISSISFVVNIPRVCEFKIINSIKAADSDKFSSKTVAFINPSIRRRFFWVSCVFFKFTSILASLRNSMERPLAFVSILSLVLNFVIR